jgi:hypothetical protein
MGGCDERIVVADDLIGIRSGERGHHFVKPGSPAQVSQDRRRVTGPGVRAPGSGRTPGLNSQNRPELGRYLAAAQEQQGRPGPRSTCGATNRTQRGITCMIVGSDGTELTSARHRLWLFGGAGRVVFGT